VVTASAPLRLHVGSHRFATADGTLARLLGEHMWVFDIDAREIDNAPSFPNFAFMRREMLALQVAVGKPSSHLSMNDVLKCLGPDFPAGTLGQLWERLSGGTSARLKALWCV
jgi:hypothetical protein